MPAVSFSTMKGKILSGEKKQTIRPKRSDYWLKWGKEDRLVGYWKLRASGESEKLFDSELSEDPFVTRLFVSDDKGLGAGEYKYLKEVNRINRLAIQDGFEGYQDMQIWFLDKYGDKAADMEFVVLRWK